jgi:predicted GNAT family acetyltransferase
MKIQRYLDATDFLERARPQLMQEEVQNNVILGLCHRLSQGRPFSDQPPYLAIVEEAGQFLACAVRTPPHQPVISRGTVEALDRLLEDLIGEYGTVGSVHGPDPDARRFAELWSSWTSRAFRPGVMQRLFEIRAIQPLQRRAPGHLRLAAETDVEVVGQWLADFYRELRLPAFSDVLQLARDRIRQESVFLWSDGTAVSMAICVAGTPNGVRVGGVYTPPEYRQHGYATTCVADLSARLLGQGNRFCCLFTDLANPTSNHIYETIGYRAVCEWSEYLLASAAEK